MAIYQPQALHISPTIIPIQNTDTEKLLSSLNIFFPIPSVSAREMDMYKTGVTGTDRSPEPGPRTEHLPVLSV